MSMRQAKYNFYRKSAICAVCETILARYDYSKIC